MKPNHDVFVGQDFWVQHRVGFFPAAKSFTWPDDNPPLAYCSRSILVSDSPPRQVNVKHQAEVIRRDRLMTKEGKEIRRKAIHQRNWREPINVHAVKQLREGSL